MLGEYLAYRGIFLYIEQIGATCEQEIMELEEFTRIAGLVPYTTVKITTKAGGQGAIFMVFDASHSNTTALFRQMLDTAPKIDFVCIITKDPLKGNVLRVMSAMRARGVHAVALTYEFFKHDITRHVLTPEHRICDAEEVKKILAQERLPSIMNFAKIRRNDPQIHRIGARAGDLVEIISPTANGYVLTYNAVV